MILQRFYFQNFQQIFTERLTNIHYCAECKKTVDIHVNKLLTSYDKHFLELLWKNKLC